MENSKTISVQKLNQAYIKLIKMVLNGTYSTTTPHINSFYHDPSPDEAYSLLNRIFYEQSPVKKQPPTTETNQSGVKKLQIRRAMTSDQRQSSRKAYEQINDLNIQVKKDTNMQKSTKKKVGQIGTSKKQKDLESQSKNQKLRRITSKITQIFETNQKKVQKFQQIKKSNGDSDYKYGKNNQNLFKKY